MTRLAAPTQRSTTAYSVQWALAGRAVLALLFGLSEGAMLFFAFWLPRITAAMMATFFTGFALLDASWHSRPPPGGSSAAADGGCSPARA